MRLLLPILLALLVTPAAAHEGHDHGEAPPPVNVNVAPRAEAVSNLFEAVAVAAAGAVDIHLDRRETNEPVSDASVELEADGQLLLAEAVADGSYRVPFAAGPGSHDLVLTVIAGSDVDVLALTLSVPEPPVAAPASSAAISPASILGDLQKRLEAADPLLLLGVATGFLGGFVAALLIRRRPTAAAALALLLLAPNLGRAEVALAAIPAPAQATARDVAQRLPDGSLFVPKPTQRLLAIRTAVTEAGRHSGTVELAGRVVPDPNASGYVQASLEGRLFPPEGGFPQLGQRVERGQLLATVEPTLGAADAVDIEQQRRALDQDIALARQKLDRLRRLVGAVPEAQVADADLELKGLLERRAGLESGDLASEPLLAPASGVIAAGRAVAGQIATPGSTIFQIADPKALWVEALSFSSEPLAGPATGLPAGGSPVALSLLGIGLAELGQATPVQFRVTGSAPGLRAGQLLTVLAEAESTREGLALPREAVVRAGNGQALVYEHTTAERFEPREVRVAPLDGARVLVLAGIGDGARVVTQGAELLNQIR
ncbi:efflux RND transporter periplasmic adaptor subunit [Cereibacter sediminicola]|uniref:efflux RND transporter periplasmic adaptor subunit n=1 Tax=Cereibacter sediminicola TaxID=2584941 RepID=UPI0011A18102|nr:efflux RND transporter periplasmic adaptor subunit [Cereibacter sediminicola]